MIAFSHPLALMLFIPLLAVTVWAWRYAYTNLSERRMRLALGVRLAVLLALILGLAGMSLRLPQDRQSVVFVADLSASDYGQRTAVKSFIGNAENHRPGSGTTGVVAVGRQPVVEQPVAGANSFDGFQSSIDRNYTNLSGGLDLANAILPPGYQHRVVVLSDGRQNVGNALATARLLHSQGVRVDVAPVHTVDGAEVLVDRVTVPPQLRQHENFTLAIDLRSTVDEPTALTILRDRTPLGSYKEAIRAGENHFTFPQPPLSPGFHTYSVEITPAQDTQPENNAGTAFTAVQGAPRVLVVAAQPAEAANVIASLKTTGSTVDLKRPAAVTPELSFLQRYAAVVIVDTTADDLGPGLMAQLVPYVRDLGHGLVVIGGQNAYNMGGYGGTPLEQALPVSADLPKKRALPTVAVVLIIESLEEDTQINISKEAGKSMINLLTPQDEVAVNDAPFDSSSPGWVVPLEHVTNRAAIDGAIDRMAPGDPDSYTPPLQAAFDALKRSTAKIKHIILLGDGDAEDSTYQDTVQKIHAAGITLSTVSTNGLGRNDTETMRSLAQWGGGRYYTADNPARIPQIFLRETRTVARLGIVEGKFFPQELSANPMVHDLKGVAALYGYVATTPKPAGEIVLASKKLDPILAGWQYGLGRSVAWTSDASGLWSRDWLRMPGANRFWANLVSWVLPAAGGTQLAIGASSAQGQGRISVETPPSLGPDPAIKARVLAPGGGTATIDLQPSSPNHYGGSFAETGQGAYFVTVEAHGGGHAVAGQIGMDVPYSAEYRTVGTDFGFLHTLAAAGGGAVIKGPLDSWLNNLPAVPVQYNLATWLFLLAILLIPVDVGVRRLTVTRRELASILGAIPWRRTATAAPEPGIAIASAVRARRKERAPAQAAKPIGVSLTADNRWGVRPPAAGRPESSASVIGGVDGESTTAQLLAARRRKGRSAE